MASLPVFFQSPSFASGKLNAAMAQSIDVQLLSSDYTFYVRGTDIPNPLVAWAIKPIDQVFLGKFGPGVAVPYPASAGWLGVIGGGFLTGHFYYPTAQESITQGTETLNSYIKDARVSDPNASITVVSLSQGSIVASASALALLAEGFDTTNIRYVAAGNPTRANGGLAARLPFHFEIPGLFSAGGNDITSNPPPTNGADFVLVTNQYDPFGDAPLYLNNPLAIANLALSFATGGVNAPFWGVGPHTYDYTYVDPTNPAATPGAIVNTYGNQTDVLLPNPVGYLPITGLLRGIVSQKLIDAVDPFLRSIIETAYDRNLGADNRTTFQWAPPASQRAANLQSVKVGFKQMMSNFKEIANENRQSLNAPTHARNQPPSRAVRNEADTQTATLPVTAAPSTRRTVSKPAPASQHTSPPRNTRPPSRARSSSDSTVAKAAPRNKPSASRASKTRASTAH